MSFTALLSTRAFRPDPQKLKTTLAERFLGDRLGFVSMGAGGIVTATVTVGRNRAPVVRSCATIPPPENSKGVTAALCALRKSLGRSIGRRSVPTVLGSSSQIEWHLKRAVQIKNQEGFSHNIRTDPQFVLGSPTDGFRYTGLLQESTNTALVFGTPAKDLLSDEESLQVAFLNPVRRVIPAMAVLNLLLADERVKKGGYTPLVIDQGHAIAVLTGDSGWSEVYGRRFVGPGYSPSVLTDLLQQIAEGLPNLKFLSAISDANGGVSAEQILTSNGANLTPFTIADINANELFVYASAIL